MFMTKTTASLIAIAIASSLIAASGGIVGSGVAAAKKESQKSENEMSIRYCTRVKTVLTIKNQRTPI